MSRDEEDYQFEEKRPPMDRWGSRTFLFLFHDMWFRIVLIVGLILAVFFALFLPRIWIRTPPGFEPQLRSSGLDLVQAWRLKQAAADLAAAGKIEDSIDTWSSAELNDPGDPAIPRGALRAMLLERQPKIERLFHGYERGIHLLRLTQTNQADLELVAEYFAARNLHRDIAAFIPPGRTNLGPRTASALAAAAFDSRKMGEFQNLWNRHQAVLQDDPPALLRHAAWAAEWGPASGSLAGRRQLEAAALVPATRNLAQQLMLVLAGRREDLPAYKSILAQLVENHADRPQDHLGLWRMLKRSGQAEEVKQLARRYSAPATDPYLAGEYASTLLDLNLPEMAADYLERELPNFGFEPALWRAQARNLVKLKRWAELRNLAVKMRSSAPLRGRLDGFAAFLDGYAETAVDRSESAAPLFAKASGDSFGSPDLAYECALTMRSVGHAVPALKLFNTLTNVAVSTADFWSEYSLTAAAAKDVEATVYGARLAYELAPANTAYQHNYASALLAARRNPAQSVQLTFARLEARPDDQVTVVNHALALLQVGRFEEAKPLLDRIPPLGLTPDQNADLQLAWFEYYAAAQQPALARMAYSRLETRRLFPPQVRWVEEKLASLSAK